jgi:hypothetical protein
MPKVTVTAGEIPAYQGAAKPMRDVDANDEQSTTVTVVKKDQEEYER